jgi:hypothetical protein
LYGKRVGVRRPAFLVRQNAALAKVNELEARIEEMERLKAGIETLLRRRKPGPTCPLLEALVPCE